MSDLDDNPFRAPESDLRVEGVLSGTRDDLRSVAGYQRWVAVCILIYLGMIIGRVATEMNNVAIPPEAEVCLEACLKTAGIAALLAGTVFVFLLSAKVYGTGRGLLFAFLTLIPCLGFLVLLWINAKATSILKANGINVGFWGQHLTQVRTHNGTEERDAVDGSHRISHND